MRYIAEVNPNLSETCLGFIEENITPSMWSQDEDPVRQYLLIHTYDTIQDIVEGNRENLYGIYQSDLEELERLLDEDVDYIEF